MTLSSHRCKSNHNTAFIKMAAMLAGNNRSYRPIRGIWLDQAVQIYMQSVPNILTQAVRSVIERDTMDTYSLSIAPESIVFVFKCESVLAHNLRFDCERPKKSCKENIPN